MKPFVIYNNPQRMYVGKPMTYNCKPYRVAAIKKRKDNTTIVVLEEMECTN